MAEFDARSEKNLKTLLPAAQQQARRFLRRLREAGINARIISGKRSHEEQNELYAWGRTKSGPIITNARGGYSHHNFGIAWDIGIFKGNQFVDQSPLYDKAGAIGESMGLEWGGHFDSIIDKPHFQVKTGKTLAQMRKLHERGEPILPVAKPTPIPPPPTPIRRVLLLKEPHLRGDDVRALQKAISKSGISILVDGDFGRATHAALKKFQAQKSLVADGIAGPKTRAVLGI